MTPDEQNECMEEYKRTFNFKTVPEWTFREETNDCQFHALMDAIKKKGIEWEKIKDKHLHKPGITAIVNSIRRTPENIEGFNKFCKKLNGAYLPTVKYLPAPYLVFDPNCIYIFGYYDTEAREMIWNSERIIVNFPYSEVETGRDSPGLGGAPTFTWEKFSELFLVEWSDERSPMSNYWDIWYERQEREPVENYQDKE